MAAAAACLLLVSNVVFEGFRFRAGNLRLTATSPWRTLIFALVLAGVRHALVRSPALHQRLIGRLRQAWSSETRRIVLPAFVASRTMVLFVGFMAVVIIGYAPNTPPFRVSRNHCEIDLARDGTVVVCDRGSFLGCLVNGEHIGGATLKARAKLRPGENLLVVGDPTSPFQFRLTVAAPA